MTSRRLRLAAPVALLVTLLTACAGPPATDAPGSTPGPAESPTAAPSATRPAATPPTPAKPGVVLPDGTEVSLELAVTPEEHAQGLMFRPDVPEGKGMLFLFSEPTYPRFWMKNTWTPLDIIFLDAGGEVVSVVADAPPCREEPCPEYSPPQVTDAVLEVRAGTAARHGVAAGVILHFAHVPGYPSATRD